jgi:glycosyltransferase involved in cell wall biosynthesis
VRILFVHQFFTTDKEPGEVRHIEMFRHLAREGYEFHIIGGALNYLTGALYPDFHGPVQEIDLADPAIRFVRVHAASTYRKGFLGRIWTYLTFALNAIKAGLRAPKPDLVMTTSPSLFTALAGYILSRLKGVPCLLEIRDLWPLAPVEMGLLKNRAVISFSYRLEKYLCRKAQKIVVITQGYKVYLVSRGIEADKIHIIPNGVDEWMLNYQGSPLPAELAPLKDKFIVAYSGAIGKFNHLEELLGAAEILKDRKDIFFILIGDGNDRENLENICREKNLDNILFLGLKTRREIPDFLQAAALTVVIHPPIPLSRLLLQNKMLDCLALGKPVLLVSDPGDSSRVIGEAGCGETLRHGPENLAKMISWCREHEEECRKMGQNGRQYAREHFLRKNLAMKLKEVLTPPAPDAGTTRETA